MSGNGNTQQVNVQSGMSWIAWFFLLFYNFGNNQDLYDAIIHFLMK